MDLSIILIGAAPQVLIEINRPRPVSPAQNERVSGPVCSILGVVVKRQNSFCAYMTSEPNEHMSRRIVRTHEAPPSPPTYSQAVKAAGLVFVSGTGPFDPATGKITGTTIQEQTRQCLSNISAILDAAGSSLDKIASATVILLDEEDFPGLNEEWLRWFAVDPPARQGAKLPVRIPGMKVSIAVIAEA
jgi:2-iminobutanoate/2-iminopropanoate deaminase